MSSVSKFSKREIIKKAGCIFCCLALSLFFISANMVVYGETAYADLTDLTAVNEKSHSGANGGKPYYNTAFESTSPIKIGGTTGMSFEKGISFHPADDGPAYVEYNIAGLGYTTFSAIVGPDGYAAADQTSIAFVVKVDDVTMETTPVMSKNGAFVIAVDITEGNILRIECNNGGDTVAYDAASIGNPRLSKKNVEEMRMELWGLLFPKQEDGTEKLRDLYISDANVVGIDGHPGFENDFSRDKWLDDSPLVIGEMNYSKGIGMHANDGTTNNTRLYCNIAGLGFETFSSYVGIARTPDLNAEAESTVQFVVYVDEVEKARSPVMKYEDEAFLLEVDVAGANVIRLEIENVDTAACDHAAWGDAKLTNPNNNDENGNDDGNDDNPKTGDNFIVFTGTAAAVILLFHYMVVVLKRKKEV